MKMVHCLPAVALFALWCVSSTEAQSPLVNQAGYLPDQPKYAYFTVPTDSFFVVEASTGQTCYRGVPQLTAEKDPATGLRTSRGDFSTFARVGTYRVAGSSSAYSFPFSISRSVFESVYKKSLKGFYLQRCGVPLSAANAGPYARPICHIHDGVLHPSAGKAGRMPTTGGWHDAGDYGKYVVNAGITIGTLMRGYELFPAKFTCDDLNIPESGNGIPDMLDEVRFELEWLLTMQDTTDGGVYSKITTEAFDDFEMAQQDTATRYIYQKSTAATGDFAAVLAQAGRVYAAFDAPFAARCTAAARHAWQWLDAHPSIVPPRGFHNPSGTNTGEYADWNDSDERLWAAAELYETTGETRFHAFYEAHYRNVPVLRTVMSWGDVRALAHITYLFSKRPTSSPDIQTNLKKGLDSLCSSLVTLAGQDGLNVTLKLTDYRWGSNGDAMNNAVMLIVGSVVTGNPRYHGAALEQLNYVLGCNAMNISYITGVGAHHVMHPHHRPSGSDGVEEPLPGLLAGGPNRYLNDDLLRATYSDSTPPARCYMDDQRSYASNEIAINWNAPLVLVAGFFNEVP